MFVFSIKLSKQIFKKILNQIFLKICGRKYSKIKIKTNNNFLTF